MEAFNYGLIAETADQLVIMMYNEHGWPGSGSGPVSSTPWMEAVLDYALQQAEPRRDLWRRSAFSDLILT